MSVVPSPKLAQSLGAETLPLPQGVQPQGPQLADILDLSPDGFVAFDRQGVIAYVNPCFSQMTLLSAAQVQGLDDEQFWQLMGELCRPRSRAGDINLARSSLQDPRSQRRCPIELNQPAGRVLMVTQRSSPAGSVSKILCFRDVSHETEVDRLKSEFISTAAHELRGPLASIFGFSETLLKQKTDAASRKEFIGIIYQQSQAMSTLLNEMLDLARIEARRQTDFDYQRIPAVSLVQSVLGSFQRPPGRGPAQLEVADAELFVRVDLKKASQVLLNVLSNAYKYSPAGGPVVVRIEVSDGAGHAPEVAIHITDQGMGMTAAELARMFERFYRAHPGSKIGGTGLGMSIAKEIMTLLGGRIEIQSWPELGTRVSLFLPAA